MFKGFLGNTIVQLTLLACSNNAYTCLRQLITLTANKAAIYKLKLDNYYYLYN